MSKREIITTAEGHTLAPLAIYQFPPDAGCFVGTLAYRAWHPKKPCLVCYFDTDCGKRFKLLAWWKRDSKKSYSPKKSCVNFADDAINGSRWKCEFDRARGGSITWQTAEEIVCQRLGAV